MIFVRLPIVFFIVGNHGDISRFLQELINQIEIMIQQQVEIQYLFKLKFIIRWI